jgi:hypothetical protein
MPNNLLELVDLPLGFVLTFISLGGQCLGELSLDLRELFVLLSLCLFDKLLHLAFLLLCICDLLRQSCLGLLQLLLGGCGCGLGSSIIDGVEEPMMDFLLTAARMTEVAFLVELATFNREILSIRVEAVLAE